MSDTEKCTEGNVGVSLAEDKKIQILDVSGTPDRLRFLMVLKR